MSAAVSRQVSPEPSSGDVASRHSLAKKADEKNGLETYYEGKVADMEMAIQEKKKSVLRLEAQRNILNAQVRALKEEIQRLQEPPANVGEVVRMMSKERALVKMHPDGKYAVDVDKKLATSDSLKVGTRVALRSDTYKLFKALPSKVDPLVSLMMVEKVPDATYDMIGGLDNQIKEIKEVIELPIRHPELFEALGVAQPKGVLLYGPPGTGKTLLARAAAHHTDCRFIRVSGSELVQKYIGEGSRMVRELFIMARLVPFDLPPLSRTLPTGEHLNHETIKCGQGRTFACLIGNPMLPRPTVVFPSL